MSDHQQCSFEISQIFLQPVSHNAVQMVGRLVQNQKLRPAHKHTCQGHPFSLAPRKCLHLCIMICDSQFIEHTFGLDLHLVPGTVMGFFLIVPHDAFQNRIPFLKFRYLWQITNVQIPPPCHRAFIRFFQSCQNF